MNPKLFLITLPILLMVACGGSSPSQPPPAAAAPVVVSGVVGGSTAQPSLNRMPLDLRSAIVTQNGLSSTSKVVQPGAVVRGQATTAGGSLQVQSMDVNTELQGPVTAVDVPGSKLFVMNQPVEINALTVMVQEKTDGTYSTMVLADFRAGDLVSVYGGVQANGAFLATRVEKRKAGTDSSHIEFTGQVSNLDATAKTFSLGTFQVSYGGAQVQGLLANGVRAEVRGSLAGTVITASKVEVEGSGNPGTPGVRVELHGPISALDTGAKTFKVLDWSVNYAQATVQGTLANGAMAEVEGTLAQGSTSTVNATKVEITFGSGGSDSSDREVKGPISSVDVAGMTLSVMGVTYWADARTMVMASEDMPLGFAQLKVGDWVELRVDSTHLNGQGQAYAARIKRESADAGGASELKGSVSSVNAAAQTFVLSGFTISVTSSTVYEREDMILSAASFWIAIQAGSTVEVKGTANGTAFTAAKIEIKGHS